MRICLVIISSLGLLCSCSLEQERKPVGPQGSVEGDMPWNTPQAGEGQGAMGGMFNQYR